MPLSRRSSRQTSSGKLSENRKSDKIQSQWTFLVEDSVLQDDCDEGVRPVICKLRHPKTESGSLFMFANGGRDVFEATCYKEEFRSWFIEETVQQDGGMTMMTPVDPLFLVMPYLIKSEQTGKFMVLSQIVTDEDYPECNRLLNCTGLEELHQITEVRGDDEFRAYKFDKEKTLSWLKLKTEIVADVLIEKQVHVSQSSSHSAMFVRSKKEELVDKDLYLKYAWGIVSDYLPQTISSELREYLGIKDIPVAVQSPAEEPPAKRAKLGDITPTEDYSKPNELKKQSSKEVKLTAAQKKLSKVDKTGMKSIASFFSPKSKT